METDSLEGAILTHYYRAAAAPFQRLTALSDDESRRVVASLQARGDIEYRLERAEYLPERRRIEQLMEERFRSLGGKPLLRVPYYFVLGTFEPWERDGWRLVEVALRDVPAEVISFTLTDSFFNYRSHNLRGVAIPPRGYHGEMFTLAQLSEALRKHARVPGTSGQWWEPYIEAQVWSALAGMQSP